MGSSIHVLALLSILLLVSSLDAFHNAKSRAGLHSGKRDNRRLPLVRQESEPRASLASPTSPSSSSFPSSSAFSTSLYGSPTTMVAVGSGAAAAASSPAVRAGFLGLLNAFFKNYPYLSSFLSTGLKASLADFAAQATDSDKKKGFNLLRNLTFLLYGGLYQGCAQYFLYNVVFPQLFGTGTDPTSVAKKVFADLLILTPFLCLPSVYFLKAIVFRYSFKEAARKYWTDVKEQKVVFKYWMLWAPVQTLTFGFVPPHLRILFIAGVSFFWLIILSKLTSSSDAKQE